jgi:hypothetical protein
MSNYDKIMFLAKDMYKDLMKMNVESIDLRSSEKFDDFTRTDEPCVRDCDKCATKCTGYCDDHSCVECNAVHCRARRYGV